MSFAARLLNLFSTPRSGESNSSIPDIASRADYEHILIVSIPLWFEEETLSGRCHDETLVGDFEVFLESHHLAGVPSISSAYGAVSSEESMRRYRISLDPAQTRNTEKLVRDWFERARNIRTARRFLFQTAGPRQPNEADMYRRMIVGIYLCSQARASTLESAIEAPEPGDTSPQGRRIA